MNASSDPRAQMRAQGGALFMAAIGAPRSMSTYLALQWGALTAQLLFFIALNRWIASPPLKFVLLIASVGVGLKLLSGRGPPSLQLRSRGQAGDGVRLSGRFEERHIPAHKPAKLQSIALEGNRLVFRVQDNDAGGTVSLNGDAFAVLGTRALHDLAGAMLEGDADAFTSIAKTHRMKLRQKPGTTGVSSIEPKWLHLALLVGSLGIIALFYALRHQFLR